MTGTPSPADSARLSISSSCLVVAKPDGVHMQQGLWAPPWPLDLAQLELLAALDAAGTDDAVPVRDEVVARTGAPEGPLNEALFRLRLSENLIVGPPASHRPAPTHPDLGEPVGTSPGLPGGLADDDSVVLRTPFTLRLYEGRYELIDHDGWCTARLTPADVAAVGHLGRPTTIGRAFVAQQTTSGSLALDRDEFASLIGALVRSHLLVRDTGSGELEIPEQDAGVVGDAEDHERTVKAVFDRHAAAQTAAEIERERTTGTRRTKVIPVAFDMGTPAGLGMIIAHAKAYDGQKLEDHYQFRTDWVWSDDRLDEFTAEPAIYLCSDYLWSHQHCLAVSEQVKLRSPASITVHGGPDTPKYEKDMLEYFERFPYVDVIVRGEGEMTAAQLLDALKDVIGDDEPDLSVLADVPGLCYRDATGVHRTADRERIADLDTLPSPYLMGLFDAFTDVPDVFVTFETNRGCPYGCTFCDWGSATTSRIRKFDLERVFAEIDWCSGLDVSTISVADANFGIFARDVEIAQRVADGYRQHRIPRSFGVSYAKNTVKHVREIISILADSGIMAQGVLSLQTMDPSTLDVIHRSNIKTSQYDELAKQMRLAKLPLMVELMMGLPGQTVDSFADDLQQCIDRNIPARINITTLLVNSPMNEAAYLEEHGIETNEPLRPGVNAVVVATKTFDRDGHAEMTRLRSDFMLFENFSVLRHVAPFVRRESDMREIDLYRLIRTRTTEDPQAWPALHALVAYGADLMAPPHSWSLVLDDLRRFLISEAGIEDGSALDTVLATQHALLPSFGRTFPQVVELPHDIVAWNERIMLVKADDHLHDWEGHVPRLGELPPGRFTVEDPDDLVGSSLGISMSLNGLGFNWELDSPLSRSSVAAAQFADWFADSMLTNKHNAPDVDDAVAIDFIRRPEKAIHL